MSKLWRRVTAASAKGSFLCGFIKRLKENCRGSHVLLRATCCLGHLVLEASEVCLRVDWVGGGEDESPQCLSDGSEGGPKMGSLLGSQALAQP